MDDGRAAPTTPEAWELDDLSRMRRIHEDLDREYLEIPEARRRAPDAASAPGQVDRQRPTA
jgi:hypothetical protein